MNDVFVRFANSIVIFFKKHEALCLFLLFFIVYNLNFRTIGAGDTVGASLLPFSILENHNLYLDNQAAIYYQMGVHPWFLIESKGHWVSFYPIVTPVLITPLYIAPYILLKLINFPFDMLVTGFVLVTLMEMISASIIVAISGIFVFLSLKELINRRIAVIGAIIFAFATNTWTISSQALWQHGLAELLLSMLIYLVIVNEKKKANKNILYMGILSGLFVFNRPVDSILLLPILFYILNLRDRKFIYYFGAMFASGAPFLFYNFYYFGNLFGGYSNSLSLFSLNSGTIISFLGLLISPSRGLFVYTPILLLSIFGYLKIAQIASKRIRNFLFIFGFSVLTQILIYSSFGVWWAGWSYGPRFLTGMLPILVIFVGLYLNDCVDFNKLDKKRALSIGLVFALLILSIFVQIIGVFYYPNGGWDGDPNTAERVWDLKDTQIMRSFNAGAVHMDPLCYFYDSRVLLNANNLIIYGNLSGWYGSESWNYVPTRWIENNSGAILIYSPQSRMASLHFLTISFNNTPRIMQLYLNNEIQLSVEVISYQDITTEIKLKKGENVIRFYTPEGCQRVESWQGPRCISLAFQNITVSGCDQSRT